MNGGLLWIWLAQRTTRRPALCTRHDDDDDETRRLAESFQGLNSSLEQWSDELCSCQDTCKKLLAWLEARRQCRPAVKVIEFNWVQCVSELNTCEWKKILHQERVLHPNLASQFCFSGSLTTPPCSESVVWTVFADPIRISPAQVSVSCLNYPAQWLLKTSFMFENSFFFKNNCFYATASQRLLMDYIGNLNFEKYWWLDSKMTWF